LARQPRPHARHRPSPTPTASLAAAITPRRGPVGSILFGLVGDRSGYSTKNTGVGCKGLRSNQKGTGGKRWISIVRQLILAGACARTPERGPVRRDPPGPSQLRRDEDAGSRKKASRHSRAAGSSPPNAEALASICAQLNSAIATAMAGSEDKATLYRQPPPNGKIEGSWSLEYQDTKIRVVGPARRFVRFHWGGLETGGCGRWQEEAPPNLHIPDELAKNSAADCETSVACRQTKNCDPVKLGCFVAAGRAASRPCSARKGGHGRKSAPLPTLQDYARNGTQACRRFLTPLS